MRLSEDQPLHPEVRAELEAIDATLRGEPVDPVHAELAELALLVAAARPQMPADAIEALDAKIARRFVPLSASPQAGDSAVKPPRCRRVELLRGLGGHLRPLRRQQ